MELQPPDEDERPEPPNAYAYDEGAAGMQGAVERARRRPRAERSDLAMVDELIAGSPPADTRPLTKRPAHEVPGGASAIKPAPPSPIAQRRHAPDDLDVISGGNAGEATPQPIKPTFGPVEPPPPTPEPEFEPEPFPTSAAASAAPAAPKQDAPERDEMRELRLKAIRSASRLLDAPTTKPALPADLSDEALQEAQGRDRQRVRSSNLTEALQAMLQRRPQRVQQEPSEEQDLLARRDAQQKQADAGEAGRARLTEALTRALKGEKPDVASLVEFRRAQTERWRADNARADTEAQRKADEAARVRDAEGSSLASERSIILADPRAKRFGLTPEMLSGLDRKGLNGIRRQVESLPKEKAATKPGAGLGGVKAGDISTVPEQYRGVVQAIAEGRAEAPKAANKFGADVLRYVMAYEPDFDATKFGAYKKVVDAQATGKDIVAVDVAREHLGTARSLIPKNADVSWFNRFKQQLAAGTGDPEFTRFMVAATVSAHETAKAYGVEDQEGKRELLHLLNAAQSPAQLASAFDTFEELMAGKQRGLQRQRERVAPAGPGHGGGKVTVSNGKETLRIDPGDLAEAEADGYSRVR